nr:Hypothetical protein [Brochothrix thermosphacta]
MDFILMFKERLIYATIFFIFIILNVFWIVNLCKNLDKNPKVSHLLSILKICLACILIIIFSLLIFLSLMFGYNS